MKKIILLSFLFATTMLSAQVPASLHAYPTGGHGWGFRDNFTYKRQWTEELEKWLREGLVFPTSESTSKK